MRDDGRVMCDERCGVWGVECKLWGVGVWGGGGGHLRYVGVLDKEQISE